jgi:hypothetical protein
LREAKGRRLLLPPARSPFPSASVGLWALGCVWEWRLSVRGCRLGPRVSRVRFPATASRRRRRRQGIRYSRAPPRLGGAPLRCRQPSAWRRGTLRGSTVQESYAGGSSGGEFDGLLFRGWGGSLGLYGRQESGAAGDGALVDLWLAAIGFRRWPAATESGGFGLRGFQVLDCNFFVFRDLCAIRSEQLPSVSFASVSVCVQVCLIKNLIRSKSHIACARTHRTPSYKYVQMNPSNRKNASMHGCIWQLARVFFS